MLTLTVLILVWGFASGVIPGFVPVEYEYQSLEEVKASSSYNDLISAVSSQVGSLFC